MFYFCCYDVLLKKKQHLVLRLERICIAIIFGVTEVFSMTFYNIAFNKVILHFVIALGTSRHAWTTRTTRSPGTIGKFFRQH